MPAFIPQQEQQGQPTEAMSAPMEQPAKFNQKQIESGEVLESEEDMNFMNSQADVTGDNQYTEEDFDVYLKEGLGEDDYNLLQMYLTPELFGLLDKLFLPAYAEINPVLKPYFEARVKQEVVLIPMDRTKLQGQQGATTEVASQPNSDMEAPMMGTEVPANTAQPVPPAV